jgi:hypothetical protein
MRFSTVAAGPRNFGVESISNMKVPTTCKPSFGIFERKTNSRETPIKCGKGKRPQAGFFAALRMTKTWSFRVSA